MKMAFLGFSYHFCKVKIHTYILISMESFLRVMVVWNMRPVSDLVQILKNGNVKTCNVL